MSFLKSSPEGTVKGNKMFGGKWYSDHYYRFLLEKIMHPKKMKFKPRKF